MSRILKIVLPILILTVGILATAALIGSKPEVETVRPEPVLPLVRVMAAVKQDVSLVVHTQGTVRPRTVTTLVAQVAAEVVAISPSFEVGGFFAEGEVLVELDARDYELAVESMRARVAQAELRLAEQLAEGRVARDEWRELGEGEPEPLVLREPQIAEARAVLAAAQAELQKSQLYLERAWIRAPFSGRLHQKDVGVGQYLTPGQPVATLHAIDYAEVRLPIPHQQLRFLDVSLGYRDGNGPAAGPFVALTSNFTGKNTTWPSQIVRTEGEIDDRTHMIYLVARVDDPYGSGDPTRPPFAVGLFVEAEISGKTIRDAVLLPRSALRGGEEKVLVVDDEDRLRFRDVELVRYQGEEAVLDGASFGTGERVCVSPLDIVVDGMQVRTTEVEGLGAGIESDDSSVPEESAEPMESIEVQPSETQPSEAEIDVSQMTLGADAQLLQIDLLEVDERTVVQVVIRGDFEYTYFRLPDPERLAINLKGVLLMMPPSILEVGSGTVEQIRISQNQLEPLATSRIVFELHHEVPPVIERSESGLTVTFE